MTSVKSKLESDTYKTAYEMIAKQESEAFVFAQADSKMEGIQRTSAKDSLCAGVI